MEQVKVYSTPTCSYCHQAKEFLSQKGIAFDDIDVSEDPKAQDEMIEISGARSVPVIVVAEKVMVGFDASELEQALNCMKNRTPL